MTLPAYGVDLASYVAIEAAFDTPQAVVTGDSIPVVSMSIDPSQEWHPSQEHLGTASLPTEIEGKQGGKWEVTSRIRPNASGTPPDLGPILTAALGTETGSVYTLSSGQPASLQLVRRVADSLYEIANGAWVESLEVDVSGNAEPTIKASGGFASYGGLVGVPLTDASTYGAAATSVTLAAASAYKIRAGARVAFGADNGTAGAGYLVTDVSSNGLTLTISPGLVTGFGATQTVVPITPTFTASGTVAGGIACGLSIGGTSMGFISYKLKLATGIHGLDKEAHSNRATRLGRGKREVTGDISFYLLDENAGIAMKAWGGPTAAIVCRAGPNTTALRMTMSTPAARLAVTKFDVPDAEETTYSANFVARRSAANDDELSIYTD